MHKPYHYQISLGDRFGRLTVIGLSITNRLYHCVRCDCGTVKNVRRDGLYTGSVVSCGCYAKEHAGDRSRTHGMASLQSGTRIPEYDCWAHMIRRCHTPSTKGYKNYGGRGITVCDRWRYSFENFLTDMGLRPSPKHSLDRLDNDGSYGPGNCGWRTQKEQCNNTRKNRRVTHDGLTLTLTQWTERQGFTRNTIYYRLAAGWSVKAALETPERKGPQDGICRSCTNPVRKEGAWDCASCLRARSTEAARRLRRSKPRIFKNREQRTAHADNTGA